MKYPLIIEGMEGKIIEFQPATPFTAAKLFVDNKVMKQSWGKIKLINNIGKEIIIKINPYQIINPSSVEVNGKVINFQEPLKSYENILVGLPAINLCIGGFIGAIIGIIAMAVNVQIFRSKLSDQIKTILTICIDIGTMILTYVLAFNYVKGILNR